MTLVAPDRGDPELSVVVVTYGAWELTRSALDALLEHTEPQFELIVVDNGSEEPMRRWLSGLEDTRVILNDENRGFGPATNQGAEHARAEQLLLLNSDVLVTAGWLTPLREALRRNHAVAAAVPRILHPDGSLQDAGPLLAKDGTVLVYGDGDDPNRLCYRFRRTIDFGSAACMLIWRRAFEAVGGFDDAYAPAYYEDVDLARRLAREGLKIVYEPRSVVTHLRFGSSDRAHATELSRRNRDLFRERWGDGLIGRPGTFRFATEQAVIAARDAPATPRVLLCATGDRPGAGALASTVLDSWPEARVTWATGGAPDRGWAPEPWLEIGVEVVADEDAAWLDARLFHYDVVIRAPDGNDSLGHALGRTQPQARHIPLDALEPEAGALTEPAVRALAAAGIAPPATSARNPR